MGRRLPYLAEGAWVPGSLNWLIPTLQGLLSVQSAARGMDYLQSRPPTRIPASLTVVEDGFPGGREGAGAALLLFAGLVFIGLFGGWLWPIIAGHVGLSGLSGAFGYGILDQAPLRSPWLAALGVAMLAPGILLGVSRWRSHRWVRFSVALTLLFVGGWVAGYGLGQDYRTGTGLFVAAACHAALAVGIAYIAYRRPPDRVS